MDKLTEVEVLKSFLKEKGFYTKKALGQNFLISTGVALGIVEGSGIDPLDVVVEIGPGIGSLTQHLLAKTKNVMAVELDRKAIPLLQENTKGLGDLKILEADVLKVDLLDEVNKFFPEHVGAVRVVANLPYYITTPIITRLLEGGTKITSLTVMVQKEVGSRMVSPPGSKVYGALSLFVQYFTEANILLEAPSAAFYPAPKVDSVVVNMVVRKKALLEEEDEKTFFRIVRASFNQRRKTLTNGLASLFPGDKEGVINFLVKNNIDPIRRGETLSLEEFMNLAISYNKEYSHEEA